ncbi:MAG: LPS export ABC transporter permease LptF [Bdellovibrionaceae bacterium]|nr:LPS export ABC transporter permease LptF [Pseudobdellovibrionaceae bacterium]|tara:strand:+ start:4215 stop:5330 length:1116 start_codon:yes stop_codon:yes gene_type:complete
MLTKKIKSIDRYVLLEVFQPFVGGLLFFIFIFLMFQLLRLADLLIVKGVPLGILLKMTLYMSMTFLPFALPLAFLIGVLIGFGRLSGDSELIAMKAGGMSLKRISAPVFAFGTVISILSLIMNISWVPLAQKNFKALLVKVGNTKVVSTINEGTFTSGFFDLLIYAGEVDSKTNRLKDVFIYDHREPKNPLTIIAKEGEIFPVDSNSELGNSSVLKLYNGNIHRIDSKNRNYQKIDFKQYQLFLKFSEGSGGAALKPKYLTYFELSDKLDTLKPGSGPYFEHLTEFWNRISVATIPLIFVLIGIGFATARARSARASAMVVSFVVIFVYWGLVIPITNASYQGIIPAWIGTWIPNLAIGIPGWIAYRKASW